MKKGILAKVQQQEAIKAIDEKSNGLVSETVKLMQQVADLESEKATLKAENEKLTKLYAQKSIENDELKAKIADLESRGLSGTIVTD